MSTLTFLEPLAFKNLETAYFIGDGDKYIVTVSKGEQEYTSAVLAISGNNFVTVTSFTTNFIKMGSQFVQINSAPDEFFVQVKQNCIIRYRLENGKHIEINKVKHNTQINSFHITDKFVLTTSNNVTIEERNFSSATVYGVDGELLHNRDFRNVQEAKIIHNTRSNLTRLNTYGICASVRR